MKSRRDRLQGIRILFEDDYLLVIDKPAGLLTTHTKVWGRAAREAQLTADNLLTGYLRKGQLKSTKRAYLVHRLDRDTSGVMMFAKSEAIAEQLRENWNETTEKTYLARVVGAMEAKRGVYESWLREDDDGYRVRTVSQANAAAKIPKEPTAKHTSKCGRGVPSASKGIENSIADAVRTPRPRGFADAVRTPRPRGFADAVRTPRPRVLANVPKAKFARTEWEVLGEIKGTQLPLSEVRVKLHTGRKNQIRVHFAEHGHPIVGDEKYRGPKAKRMYLHSQSLKFVHPVTGATMVFESQPQRTNSDRRGVLILGAGKSGEAAAKLAKALGYVPRILDRDDAFPEDFAAKFVVVSPGIPLDHPWQRECRARRLPVKSELQFGCEELKRRGWRLIAVTGSKGKSSVVKLLAEALGGVACGNYGLPVSEVALGEKRQWAVVEVSSFQLETTALKSDTFEAATVLNYQLDHLDRHGCVEVYHALKRKLLGMAKVRVEIADDAALAAGSYFDNEILKSNAAKAIQILRAVGLADGRIAAAFREFRPLPHRFETVGIFDGVKWVDDSKATSLAALVAGVKMAGEGVRLIAGGLPKGDDPGEVLSHLTSRVKKVYLIGECAAAFQAAWQGPLDCEICGDLATAVRGARREASAGETVLLSPGAASFDQFKSFEERGEVFACLAKKGKNK